MRLVPAFPELPASVLGDRPVFLASPPGEAGRVAVATQEGRVVVFDNRPDVTEVMVLLDIRERTSRRGEEEGLLGLAFHPRYAENGELYVYYSAASSRRSVLSRFVVGADGRADAEGEEIVLTIPEPYQNHNGGMIAFGPDAYLYVGVGDGGSRGDPRGNGQDPGTLLGTILRLDVDVPGENAAYSVPPDNLFVSVEGARPEVWAYGLRNPWRFSFDPDTDDLWVGDVGQNRWEEIDLVVPGGNYGWNVMEGGHCFSPSSGCDTDGLEPPVVEYGHALGCSVTGGYVYRGERLPWLRSAYVFADFCSGRIWALRYEDNRVTEELELADTPLRIASFGVDATGELLVLAFDEGVMRIETAGN